MAATDSLIFSVNTPIREGKNLLLRMCTFDAVMMGRPLLYGEANELVFFGKVLKFFVVEMYNLTPKGWEHSHLRRSEHGCNLVASTHEASPPNVNMNFPGKFAASSQLLSASFILKLQFNHCAKLDIVPWSKAPILILPLCIQSWSMYKWLVILWNKRCSNHVWHSHLLPSKKIQLKFS